ncbi:MAG: TolC family protein [Chitinophagaceae bacterium]
MVVVVFIYFCPIMSRYKKLIFCLFTCLVSITDFVSAQTVEKWDLRKCVDYAMEHNITVRQADVQARIAALTYKQGLLSQYPSANLQNSTGYQYGRSIDPSTNQFTNDKILFANHSLNVNLDLFNWFSKKNTIAAYRLQAGAYTEGIQKAKDDIALNVANAFLQIVLNAEQIKISDVQVKQSIEQVDIIKKQVDAGALPELNLAEMESQLANDSSTLITANANYTLSVLQLKALMNIDADKAFEVEIPPVELIPVEPLADLEPAAVFNLATINMPQQKINELNLQAAIKNVAAAKGNMYPSLSLFGGLDSRYSDAQNLLPKNFVNTTIPIGFVNVSGTDYIVNTQREQPTGFTKNTYFQQVNNNFSQSLGLGLNIPIFNGGLARTNWRKARLNVTSVELQKELDSKTLKQDIYQAHANAVAAIQKFNAAGKSVETSQKAYDFAKKRFDVGLLKTIDLITNQNNLFRAKINKASAQADYVFKMKLLEFYRGQGLKL